MNIAGGADIESCRRVERTGRHQNRRHTDQRVEGCDQLRHRRHRPAACNHRTDAAADGDTEDHKDPAGGAGRRMRGQRRRDGNGHTDHAEEVALA